MGSIHIFNDSNSRFTVFVRLVEWTIRNQSEDYVNDFNIEGEVNDLLRRLTDPDEHESLMETMDNAMYESLVECLVDFLERMSTAVNGQWDGRISSVYWHQRHRSVIIRVRNKP